MKLGVFSAKQWVRDAFEAARGDESLEIQYLEPRLGPDTVRLARGFDAVCVFVNDEVSSPVLDELAEGATDG